MVSYRDCPIYVMAIIALVVILWYVPYTLEKQWARSSNRERNVTDAVCPLDFCSHDTLPRTFTHDDLLLAYGIALAMTVFYFMFERGPCHWCVAMENAYKATALMIVFVATVLWENTPTVPLLSSGSFAMRQNILAFVTLCVAVTFADLDQTIPDFFGNPSSARLVAKQHLREKYAHKRKPPRGVRVAKEVIETMLEGVGRGFKLNGQTAVFCFFAFLLLEELGFAFTIWFQLVLWLISQILLLVMGYHGLRWVYWVMCTRRSLINHLNDLVDSFMGETHDAQGLNYMLASVSVGTLINFGGSRVQNTLMHALEQDMLDVLSKAIIIDALQKIGLRGTPEQNDVRDLFMSCSGNELLQLKTLIDGSGGYQNLKKLLFTDVYSKGPRQEILDHLEAEGLEIRRKLGSSVGIKVLSDVDDTLFSSGGHFPAGCDKSYPKKVVYPGCLSLFRELDIGFDRTKPSCNLVFLSARPHIFKDVAEAASYQVFNDMVSDYQMHALPTLLPGNLWKGLRAMLTVKCEGVRAWKQVGDEKFATFDQFTQLYPEYDFVFFGDDGQGDLLAGQRMLKKDHGASLCRCVVIHQVFDGEPLVASAIEEHSSSDEDEARLIFHKSYVGAAVDIHQVDPNVLSEEKLLAVARDAIMDFDSARLTYPDWYEGPEGHEAEDDLRHALKRVEALMGPGCSLPLASRADIRANTRLLYDDDDDGSNVSD